ncbi:probable inactive poly [ADP-ribose] polymerase SRO3 [Sesamum indicum]|uniref:Probable inactive poly [ADP-ribose] polymerase SRO3 n=1 Tax=Sesamum indicum TaxID=4182 RepID=A0A6I9SUU3_SESIN|nr:probable inactive poly [ADP-ribose] polymerase SRO3 [Sesamum indicum]
MNSLNSSSMMAKKCADGKVEGRVSASRSSSALSCELLIQNYSNFKRSSVPEQFMFYEDGSWVDYPKEVMEVMRLGFAEGKPVVEAQVRGFNCFFDFYRMLEIELDTGNQRSISWIDVEGKCFFPKIFVNSCEIDSEDDSVSGDEDCRKIQIDIKIMQNSGSSECLVSNKTVKLSKRKREENGEKEKMDDNLSSINVKRRQMVGSELQSARWPKARTLATEEKGYAIVKNLFLSGLEIVEPGSKVTAIHQCVRTEPLDKARCEVFSKQMDITKQARGESNMVFAWYGTSAKDVESILKHGFRVPSKVPHPGGPGIGIHLSPIRLPQHSALLSEIDENGEKHVILCRVILGKCEKVEAGSQQMYPSSVEYDTGVDDLKNPKWYIVWHANMNTHILPECVVSYKPVNISGSVNRFSCMNWVLHPFIAKLFSKLRSSLPMSRLQELQTLWRSYKEGKLGKENFMKQLRSIVGDDVLRSTIQEIRG